MFVKDQGFLNMLCCTTLCGSKWLTIYIFKRLTIIKAENETRLFPKSRSQQGQWWRVLKDGILHIADFNTNWELICTFFSMSRSHHQEQAEINTSLQITYITFPPSRLQHQGQRSRMLNDSILHNRMWQWVTISIFKRLALIQV